MKKFLIAVCFTEVFTLFVSCQTVKTDFEKDMKNIEKEAEKNEEINSEKDELSDEEFLTLEKQKENDIAASVIYVESPEIRYDENPNSSKVLRGTDALKQNLSDITVLPEYSDGKLKAWGFHNGQIYQVHCQPYRSTIIQLEPGEKMLEVPYISETDVWRISRGVGIVDGQETEMLIVKPDNSNLTSTFIIITDRRVYQMELKSYRDHYMPYVQWVYPRTITDLASWTNRATGESKTHTTMEFSSKSAEYLSFDYVMRYPFGRRPVWCPESVYDDGKFTYIVLDKTSAHTEVPAAFIGKREIMNKEYHNNVIVINQLVEKITLRLGKDKVTVQKKITRGRK